MTADAFNPPEGVAEVLGPGLRRVLAPNPSPMTYRGTNSYLVGTDTLAVIDPGPADPAHLAALLAAIGDRPVSHIIVTHAHVDHSPLARPLGNRTGAPVLAFGDSTAGRSAVMAALAADALAGGGEGVDHAFVPDQRVGHGDTITGDGWALRVLHTPGHMGNHICLQWDDIIFTGDLVMGWASSLVSPPDGDLLDFLASCRRLQGQGARALHAGHGAPIADPDARLDWLIAHRENRTAQIMAALARGPQTVPELTRAIYADAPPGLQAAAARNVFAHLVALHQQGAVLAAPALHGDAVYARV